MSPADLTPDPAGGPTPIEDQEAPVLTPPSVSAPSRRSMVVRLAIVVGVFVLVFGIIIPSFIDYRDVVEAIRSLTAGQLLVLVLIAVGAYVVEGSAVAAPLPGLSIRRGTGVYLSSAGVKYTIPAPVDLPLRYAFFRGWGFPPGASTMAVAINGILDQVSRLILPLPAVLLYAFEGTVEPVLILLAVVGTVIFGLLVGLYTWMIRSPDFTARIGRLVERLIGGGFRLIKKSAPAGIPDRVVAFRDETRELMLRRGVLSLGVMIMAKLSWAFLLLISLRFAGVPSEVLPAPEVLAVFAAVFMIMILPIAPGGAGVPEVLFIAGFTMLTGGRYEVEITAGVFIYRIFQWFLVIPIGWTTLWILRRHAPGGLLGSHGEKDAVHVAAGGTS
jgi:uncharacterized membrane protein YbhN (UPF0104 family)